MCFGEPMLSLTINQDVVTCIQYGIGCNVNISQLRQHDLNAVKLL